MENKAGEYYVVMMVDPLTKAADAGCFTTMKECRDYAYERHGDGCQYLIARVVETQNMPMEKGALN